MSPYRYPARIMEDFEESSADERSGRVGQKVSHLHRLQSVARVIIMIKSISVDMYVFVYLSHAHLLTRT